jgi:hypothetical protein
MTPYYYTVDIILVMFLFHVLTLSRSSRGEGGRGGGGGRRGRHLLDRSIMNNLVNF